MPRTTSTEAQASNSGGRRSQRDDLLHAAMELFAKGGSRGTPLAAIADRIGVTSPAITHHFGTKQALLMEVVKATDRADLGRLDSPETSGLEQLGALRGWASALASDSDLAHLSRLRTVMVAESLDPDFTAHGHFVERHRWHQRQLAALVSAGQADGSIRLDVDPATVATEILAFMQGAQFQWFLDPDSVSLQAVFDAYFDRLEADLRLEQPVRIAHAARGGRRRRDGRDSG